MKSYVALVYTESGEFEAVILADNIHDANVEFVKEFPEPEFQILSVEREYAPFDSKFEIDPDFDVLVQ